MRNKGFEGNSILNYTFFTSINNEMIASCQFSIEFNGILTRNSLSSSFGLTFKKVVVFSIDKVETDTSRYIIDDRQFRGVIRNIMNTLVEKEFVKFEILDEDFVYSKNFILEEPFGILFK